jgi:L-aminopeptidase/D-esterase-like protein
MDEIGGPAASESGDALARGPRGRDLGIPFEGTPGTHNAITDVAGVEVGYATLIEDHPLGTGSGPVRTGVTAVWPRGRDSDAGSFAAWQTLHGNGELTGAVFIDDLGWLLPGPVLLTNTLSVGVAHEAVVRWQVDRGRRLTNLPVVAETWDGYLNDLRGFHVRTDDVFVALDTALGGPVAEGNVGGGTGMICHGYKGGTGTSSRVVDTGYTLGVLVQANHGSGPALTIAGVPVGRELGCVTWPCSGEKVDGVNPPKGGSSVVVVIATDAPVLRTELRQVARRAGLGVGRVGGIGDEGSGDIFLAFSSGLDLAGDGPRYPVEPLLEDLDSLYEATIQATEEAIINALVAAKTMSGIDGHRVEAIPHTELREILLQHGRITDDAKG